MRRASLLLVVLVLAPLGVFGRRQNIPKNVLKAHYVFVTTYFGAPFAPTVTPDDRLAVINVSHALEKWGRFQLASTPDYADLTIAVRAGTHVFLKPGLELGRGPDKNTRGYGVDAHLNHDDDLLAVYGRSGFASPPLWLAVLPNGLKGPDLPLFREFRSDVERLSHHP